MKMNHLPAPKKQTQTKPISSKAKMSANAFSQKDYENKTALRPKKTNPNKANFKRKDSLHKQCDLLYLKGSFVMGHLGRYWQTKPKVSDKLLRTGKEIRFRFWLSEDKAGKEAKRRPTGW